jgi:iron complex outermembrane recepter protein
MNIDSFTFKQSVFNAALADSDGVVRDGAPEYTLVNGKGGVDQGYEFSYQQSMTFLPGFLANTGITLNYTYSPSKGDATQTLNDGSRTPFGNTAKDQANLILWYQDDKLQTRIAANYLGKQYQGQYRNWMINNSAGLDQWLKPQLFVDLSGSYDITDKIQITLAVNNLLSENSIKYSQWENNVSQYDIYERRLTAGVTAKF